MYTYIYIFFIPYKSRENYIYIYIYDVYIKETIQPLDGTDASIFFGGGRVFEVGHHL